MTEIPTQNSPRNRVLSHLRARIDNGTYPVGSRLPSERELAQLLGVARPTVRQVLTLLDEEGAIHSNGGRLRLVSQPALETQKKGLPQVLKNTVVVVSLSPTGPTSDHRSHGWAEWIDRGVLDGASRHRLHHMAFEPSRLGDDDWENMLQAMPYGVVITDLFGKWGEALQRAVVWKERGLAVVAYGDAPDMEAFDRVSSDHELGGYLVTHALLEMGRKDILMVGSQDFSTYWFTERYQGYCRAMQEFGQNPLPMMSLPSVPSGKAPEIDFELEYRHLAGYLAPCIITSNLDAIIASSDALVPATFAACRSLGRKPNEDIIIAGYDNFWDEVPARAFESEPPLFSVDKQNVKIGKELIQMLQDRVDGKLPSEPQKRLITPTLKRR